MEAFNTRYRNIIDQNYEKTPKSSNSLRTSYTVQDNSLTINFQQTDDFVSYLINDTCLTSSHKHTGISLRETSCCAVQL